MQVSQLQQVTGPLEWVVIHDSSATKIDSRLLGVSRAQESNTKQGKTDRKCCFFLAFLKFFLSYWIRGQKTSTFGIKIKKSELVSYL